MTDWQPISTLFADGVCLVTDGYEVKPVYAWPEDDLGYDDLTKWDYDGHGELGFSPTHWMPLPDPPKD